MRGSSNLLPEFLSSESHDDTRSKTKPVLNIIGSVRELGVLPRCFHGAKGDVAREPVVKSTAGLGRKAVGAGLGPGNCWEEALEAVGFADQAFAVDWNAMVRVPPVARTECGRDDG